MLLRQIMSMYCEKKENLSCRKTSRLERRESNELYWKLSNKRAHSRA